MIVEPFANDELKDNLNPVGRVYYSFFNLIVYTLLAFSGSRAMLGRAVRRKTHSRGRHRRRLHPFSPGRGKHPLTSSTKPAHEPFTLNNSTGALAPVPASSWLF